MRLTIRLGLLSACLAAGAQTPSELDLQNLKQYVGAPQNQLQQSPDTTPNKGGLLTKGAEGKDAEEARAGLSREELLYRENARLDAEIRAMKAKEKGPRRFAADLFDLRQANVAAATDGGIAEDYVLGTGDTLAVNVFGSATFDVPAQVDGRGEIVISKVGSVKVAGLTLGKAKQAVQAVVGRQFSRATVDLQVVKLREVRVFVLGEVYKAGSYLVPSLSSLVNVLCLAGGPTAAGSFRDIRVLRGGKVVHHLDLYPFRAEGLGNVNFGLQSGDVVFVPVVGPLVSMEGAFLRVAAQGADPLSSQKGPQGPKPNAGRESQDPSSRRDPSGQAGDPGAPIQDPSSRRDPSGRPGDPGIPAQDPSSRRDPSRRLGEQAIASGLPALQVELKADETAWDAVRFMGGLQPTAYANLVTLQRVDPNGVISVQNLVTSEASLRAARLYANDTLRALARTERLEGVVDVSGQVRVPGRFSHRPGLRVRDLLRDPDQLLPDTYLGRGEIVRTHRNERQELLVFDVSKALAGDPAHDLELSPRDQVSLFSVADFRLPRKVTVSGPFTRPGDFDWTDNMRASDLVFRAGVPLLSANRYYAELAHTRDGKPSQVLRLDLAKLLSTETGSPVSLTDEAVNPRVEPFDVLSLYEKPDYHTHRSVKIQGQVARPGVYVFDQDRPTLGQLIQRAGGLTTEAMPRAGVLLRSFQAEAGPGAKGVSEILERLNETKILVEKSTAAGDAQKGGLFRPPVLHGISASKLNRLVVDFEGALKGEKDADTELLDGDEVVIPRFIDTAYVVGESASPFGAYKVSPGMTVADVLHKAGGLTRNADAWNIRLVKADGHIVDSWVKGKKVEPGDTVIVPQRFRRDTAWQDDLAALTPIALILNAIRWH